MNGNNVRIRDAAQTFYRRVGNTNFKVRVLFSESATETMEEKILRIVRNSGDHFGEKYDIISKESIRYKAERKQI